MKANFNVKKFFFYLGVSLIVFSLFTSCNQILKDKKDLLKKDSTSKDGNVGEQQDADNTKPPIDKIYKVKDVSFVMKPIQKVKDGFLGTDDKECPNNKTHKVNLDAYFVSETEVTQELFKKVMDDNPSQNTGEKNLPVDSVTWLDAVVFTNTLTTKCGLGESECVYYSDEEFKNVYKAQDAAAYKPPFQNMKKKGFRLPTEAEWEWASKGGKNDRWAGTDDEKKLKDYAWYDVDGKATFMTAKSHPVKGLKANGYGLYDMSGNVYEWCWDWHAEIDEKNKDNPVGPLAGNTKSYRGGFVISNSTATRTAWRAGDNPLNDYKFCGIRLVCRP